MATTRSHTSRELGVRLQGRARKGIALYRQATLRGTWRRVAWFATARDTDEYLRAFTDPSDHAAIEVALARIGGTVNDTWDWATDAPRPHTTD